MKFAITLTTLLVWALWLGGTIATMVIGKYFFTVFPREIAGPPANAMFHVFGPYELVLAGLCVIGAGALLAGYPSKSLLLLLGLFILAAGMAITFTLGFMPLLDSLIDQGRQGSHDFIRLHVKSMITMAIQTVLLLLTGPVLVKVIATPEAPIPRQEEEIDTRSEFEKSKGVPRGL